jgi:hypothetical protein
MMVVVFGKVVGEYLPVEAVKRMNIAASIVSWRSTGPTPDAMVVSEHGAVILPDSYAAVVDDGKAELRAPEGATRHKLAWFGREAITPCRTGIGAGSNPGRQAPLVMSRGTKDKPPLSHQGGNGCPSTGLLYQPKSFGKAWSYRGG